MNNHADSFRPPGQHEPLGDAKAMFQFISGVFIIAVHVLAAFWAMVAKQPGTVGTRSYWFDVLCANTLLIALSQNSWYPDRYLFQGSIVLITGLLLWHLMSTHSRPGHIHTKCIGESRFGPGDQGKLREFVVGAGTGLCIVIAGCGPFGLFVLASAAANVLRILMLDERDRQRNVQMADAMAEQDYMMNQYDRYQQNRNHR